MAEYVTKIRTESGDKQIDYNALANKPEFDVTLSKSGKIADSKATGDAIKASANSLSVEIQGFKTEVEAFKSEINDTVEGISTDLAAVKDGIDESISTIDAEIDTLHEAVDGLLAKNESGETVIQVTLQMNNNKITGLAEPEENTDAATKQYVDSKHFVSTATLSTEWSGDVAPYTQTLAIDGILETDNPHIAPIYSSEPTTAVMERAAWAEIYKAETKDGEITFTCFVQKPAVAINMQIEVIR
jgi:hypothetical protein